MGICIDVFFALRKVSPILIRGFYEGCRRSSYSELISMQCSRVFFRLERLSRSSSFQLGTRQLFEWNHVVLNVFQQTFCLSLQSQLLAFPGLTFRTLVFRYFLKYCFFKLASTINSESLVNWARLSSDASHYPNIVILCSLQRTHLWFSLNMSSPIFPSALVSFAGHRALLSRTWG